MTTVVTSSSPATTTTVRDLVFKCKASVEELRAALAISTTTPEVLADLGSKVELLEAELASTLIAGGGGGNASSSVGGNIIANVIPSISHIINENVSTDIVSDDSKVLSAISSKMVAMSTGVADESSSAVSIGLKRPRNDALPSANMFDDEEPQRPQQGGRGGPAATPAEPAEVTTSLRVLSEKERSMFLPPITSSTSTSGDAASSRQGFFFGLGTMVTPLPFALGTITLKKPVVASTTTPSSSSGAFSGGRGGGRGGAFRGRRGGGGGRGGRR